jgi:hypothetical protein
MRKISILAAVSVAALVAGFQSANAGLLGMPMGLQSAIQHIRFATPMLVPMAYTPLLPSGSCVECEARVCRIPEARQLADQRYEAIAVQAIVNRSIAV